jgi:two-component sensor histidine kinase
MTLNNLKRPYIFASISFVGLLVLSLFMIYLAHNSISVSRKKVAESKLNTVSQLISNSFESKIQLGNVLAGFVSYKGEISEEEFKTFSKYIISETNAKILSIQWAPKGIIRFIYPFEGNEKAKDLKLFEFETTKNATLTSLNTKKPHINGPIPLVQGGTGVIYRVPVYSIDSLDSKGENLFLGFTAVVIDWKTIVKECDLDKFDQEQIAIKLVETVKEKDYFENGVFFGNRNLDFNDILTDTLKISGNKWILGIQPKHNKFDNLGIALFIFLAIMFCLIISFFIFRNSQNIELIKKKNNLLTEKNSEIQKEIKEKMLLLNEIHHRVKNNFQLVSSLARLQSYELNEPKSIEVMQEFSNRVSSLALTHEQLLNNSDSSNKTSIKSYIHSLCENLIDKNNYKHIKVEYDVIEEHLPIKYVILLGIILNELITNSFKYAFTNRDKGVIHISLKKDGKFFELMYTDDGIGMENNILNTKKDSFGIDLINSISEQIDGQIEQINATQKSGFKIKFEL